MQQQQQEEEEESGLARLLAHSTLALARCVGLHSEEEDDDDDDDEIGSFNERRTNRSQFS